MLLEVLYGERVIPVDLGDLHHGRLQVDGREIAFDCVRISPGRFSLIVDGRVYDLRVCPDGDGWHVDGGGFSFGLRIRDPRKLAGPATVEEGAKGRQRILAEMPGKVVRVLVNPGDEVVFEQGLLILEAMKMQNEIRAPRRGTVREVAVEEGRRVGAGDFLLSLE